MGRVRAVPRLFELYQGICLTNEEKVRENFIQVSRRVSVGTMETEYTDQSIYKNKIRNLQNKQEQLRINTYKRNNTKIQ